jgi:hypothetical protein
MDIDDDELYQELDLFISDYSVFSPIRSADQVLPFRVFCSFFDYFDKQSDYLPAIAKVFDQLLVSSTTKKTMSLLNDFPQSIIKFMLNRYIALNATNVLGHLNETVKDFKYGAIRKIVRRNALRVNYKYE